MPAKGIRNVTAPIIITASRRACRQHSPLVGYIADGFGIYGNLGEHGEPLTNSDLDECHGHTHAIPDAHEIHGHSRAGSGSDAAVVRYHYHQTQEFPYTIGCYKGTPVPIF